MSNLPPITDHAFWRNLRVQCNTTKPMSRIAAELGVDIDELCAWIMDYTAKPKKVKPYVNRDSFPTLFVSKHADPGTDARRFSAWRKAQQGAAETIRMLEMSGR